LRPGNLRALAGLADAQPHAIEHLRQSIEEVTAEVLDSAADATAGDFVTSSREISLRFTVCSIGSLVSLLAKLRISSTERNSSFACSFVMGACAADSGGV